MSHGHQQWDPASGQARHNQGALTVARGSSLTKNHASND